MNDTNRFSSSAHAEYRPIASFHQVRKALVLFPLDPFRFLYHLAMQVKECVRSIHSAAPESVSHCSHCKILAGASLGQLLSQAPLGTHKETQNPKQCDLAQEPPTDNPLVMYSRTWSFPCSRCFGCVEGLSGLSMVTVCVLPMSFTPQLAGAPLCIGGTVPVSHRAKRRQRTAAANRASMHRFTGPCGAENDVGTHRAEPRPGEFFVGTFGLFVDGPFPVLCVASTCDETSLTYTHLHSHSSSLSHSTFNHSSSFHYHSSTCL